MRVLGLVLSFLAFIQLSFGNFLNHVVMEYDKPKSVSGSQMSTLGGGGVRFRWQSRTYSIFNVTPPSLKAGCSGIDLSFGALGLLNFEEFGKLFEALMGPAGVMFAFNLALSSLCPQCQTILQELGALANLLNQMQIDQCKAVELAGSFGKAMGERINTKLMGGGGQPNTETAFGKALKQVTASIDNVKREIVGYLQKYCPNNLCGLALKYKGGCVMDRVAERVEFVASGLGLTRAEFAGVMRYYLGDVCFPNQENRTGTTEGIGSIGKDNVYLPQSAEINQFIEGLLGFQQKNTQQGNTREAEPGLMSIPVNIQSNPPTFGEVVTVKPNSTVAQFADNLTVGIINKVKSRRALTSDEYLLLQAMPIPVYKLFNYGSVYPSFLDEIGERLKKYIAVELGIAMVGMVAHEIGKGLTSYQLGLDEESTSAISTLLERVANVQSGLNRIRKEAIKELREAIHTYDVATDIYNSLLAQMAYSPIYGNLVFSRLFGVRF